jgi:predicted RNase H-like HicB family nuclease
MVSHYVATALERAHCRLLEDGSFAATVRGLRGVIATGTTLEACRRALAEVVEAWILIRVARGLAIPALGRAVVRIGRAS